MRLYIACILILAHGISLLNNLLNINFINKKEININFKIIFILLLFTIMSIIMTSGENFKIISYFLLYFSF
jgi:hypothetical protein